MKQTGTQIIEQGMAWVRENKCDYATLKGIVAADVLTYPGRDLRIASYVEMMRSKGTSVPNAIRVYISRRLEREIPGARFTKAKSKINLLMEIED